MTLLPCNCLERINILAAKAENGVWVAEIDEFPFVYGYGKTKKKAAEDILKFYLSAIAKRN